jgi:uncharacterized CHY-type Zn-finger protein
MSDQTYDVAAIRNWCGVTHYAGCDCHEKIRNDELAALRAENEKLREHFDVCKSSELVTLKLKLAEAIDLLLRCNERLDDSDPSDELYVTVNAFLEKNK